MNHPNYEIQNDYEKSFSYTRLRQKCWGEFLKNRTRNEIAKL